MSQERASAAVPPTRGEAAIRKLFYWMPFLFGLGFIAPLIAQAMEYWDLSGPFGLSPIALGLIIGGAWGLYAVKVGRWI